MHIYSMYVNMPALILKFNNSIVFLYGNHFPKERLLVYWFITHFHVKKKKKKVTSFLLK